MLRLADVAWRASSAERRLNAGMRRTFVDYVDRYRTFGADSLMVYADDSTPVSVAAEFRDLAARDALLSLFPSLREYLLTFPRAPQSPVAELIYWSKEKLGTKPWFR